MQKIIITLGLVLLVIGLLYPWLRKLGLGRLPGDIIIQRPNFSFYFPLATCIIISVIITVIFWLLNR